MGARDDSGRESLLVDFEQSLAALTASEPVDRWLVAFSGGVDSTVLLHAVSRLSSNAGVVAIHIDHGLQAESGNWAEHCREVAGTVGAEFIKKTVVVNARSNEGLEAAAREARYLALAEFVGVGDVLLTAHHADDQLETVLLRLVRGAGVRGLTAVRESMAFGQGRLVRPLLDVSRADIEAEASRLQVGWAEDPSNSDTRFDRNYLRAECLPPLLARWPQAGKLASRLARRMAAAESLLEELAEQDLAAAGRAGGDEAPAEDPGRLPLAGLRQLSAARLDNLLRYVIRRCDLPTPSLAQLSELRRALDAREDAETLVSWPGAEARVYRQLLYLGPPLPSVATASRHIAVGTRLEIGEGVLELQLVDSPGIPDAWVREGLSVNFRLGGERIRPHSNGGSKPLKQWFQEQGIVPWMRSSVPLLYHGDDLVAVADIWIDDSLPQDASHAPFWRPVWSGHSRLY